VGEVRCSGGDGGEKGGHLRCEEAPGNERAGQTIDATVSSVSITTDKVRCAKAKQRPHPQWRRHDDDADATTGIFPRRRRRRPVPLL